MKRCLPVALVLTLAAACAETMPPPPSPPVAWSALDARRPPAPVKLTDKERVVAEAYIKALASPKLRLGTLLDDLVHFECGAINTRGRERVVAAHETAFAGYEQRRFALRRAWLTNDEKAIEWELAAVRDGKPATLRGLTILWTNDDASISDIHVYFAHADAAATEPHVFEKSGAPKETDNVTQMRAVVQALEDDREPQLAALFADAGRDDARAWFRATHKALSHLDTVIGGAWGVDDYVVIEYALSGQRRESSERRAVADVGELRDGRITRIWRFDAPAIEGRTAP
jgi:hypothetical protein